MNGSSLPTIYVPDQIVPLYDTSAIYSPEMKIASPKNVYTMNPNRYVPSSRNVEETMLTDDSITEICKRMSVRDLEAFVSTSYKNLILCNSILDEKIKYELKIKLRDKILLRLKHLPSGFILDVSSILDNNIDDTDNLKELLHVDWNLVKVPGYPRLYVRRSKLDIILDILNTK
jgi:hypothetical protein